MKKPRIPMLVVLTCVFAAFLVGFFAGRNINRTPVHISQLPAPAAETQAPTQPAAQTAPAPTEPGILDINTATAAQLESLPGIGPVLAQRIVDYRAEFGNFHAIGDLTNVNGIGIKKLEAILDYITIGA